MSKKQRDYSKCDSRIQEKATSPYFPHTNTSTILCFFYPELKNTHVFRALNGQVLKEEKLEAVLKAIDYVLKIRKDFDLEKAAQLEAQSKAIKETALNGGVPC